MEIRSVAHEGDELLKSKCQIRFFNCTKYKLEPHWIDFRGIPIKYPTLPRGASINMDTFKSHLWYFKPVEISESHRRQHSNSPDSPRNLDTVRILAIPQKTIEKKYTDTNGHKSLTCSKPAHAFWTYLMDFVCPLCKLLIKQFDKMPATAPCPHFALNPSNPNEIDSYECYGCSNYNSTYIYSCNEKTHREEHSSSRQNIFLIEVLHNLKELCFIKLQEASRCPRAAIAKSNAPTSLQEDYIQFATSLKILGQ